MNKKPIFILALGFVAAVLAGAWFFQNKGSIGGKAVEVDWHLLGELDYITGKASAELQRLDNTEVRIPGFMVPLEDDNRNVTEFLLVPSPQACIHVPPPPPNQMVLVQMAKGSQTEVAFGPIWIYGKLKLFSKRHTFGESSFVMDGERVEPYQ